MEHGLLERSLAMLAKQCGEAENRANKLAIKLQAAEAALAVANKELAELKARVGLIDGRDAEAFLGALENPPEPNEHLRRVLRELRGEERLK